MTEDTDQPFEQQIDHIDDLSTPELTLKSPPPKKPKLTRAQTKSAILKAMKNGDITVKNGKKILSTLGLDTKQKNKKIIDNTKRKNQRKTKKLARKTNRTQ